LIDDLVNKGTDEPYRMFTSRAEFRILLRQDNADLRLTELGHKLGLATDEGLEKMIDKKNDTSRLLEVLKKSKVEPAEVNEGLDNLNTATIKEKVSALNLLKRPEVGIKELIYLDQGLGNELKKYDKQVLAQGEILIKYETYIGKEKKLAEKIESIENHKIPAKLNYDKIKALSAEGREKLIKVKPTTIGQASRISGVSPADVSILMVYMGK